MEAKQNGPVLQEGRCRGSYPGSYRPIALNTLYKLWTKSLAIVLSSFCEHHGVLSDSQEGFRPYKACTRQLHFFRMVLPRLDKCFVPTRTIMASML